LLPPVLKQENIIKYLYNHNQHEDGSRENSQNVPTMYLDIMNQLCHKYVEVIFIPDVIFLKGKEVQKA
jgi:hypothetical protein